MFTHYLSDSESSETGRGKHLIRFWNLCFLCSRICSRLSPFETQCICSSHSTACSSEIGREQFELMGAVLHRHSANQLYLFRTLWLVTGISISEHQRADSSLHRGVCNTPHNKFMVWPWTTKCNGAENADTHYISSYTAGISLSLLCSSSLWDWEWQALFLFLLL